MGGGKKQRGFWVSCFGFKEMLTREGGQEARLVREKEARQVREREQHKERERAKEQERESEQRASTSQAAAHAKSDGLSPCSTEVEPPSTRAPPAEPTSQTSTEAVTAPTAKPFAFPQGGLPEEVCSSVSVRPSVSSSVSCPLHPPRSRPLMSPSHNDLPYVRAYNPQPMSQPRCEQVQTPRGKRSDAAELAGFGALKGGLKLPPGVGGGREGHDRAGAPKQTISPVAEHSNKSSHGGSDSDDLDFKMHLYEIQQNSDEWEQIENFDSDDLWSSKVSA
jgi:hypothetical protein